MPAQNGTGPQGPMTGRGRGRCRSQPGNNSTVGPAAGSRGRGCGRRNHGCGCRGGKNGGNDMNRGGFGGR